MPRLLPLLAALVAAMPTAVLAEKADREKPINIEADRVSMDDINKVQVFEGNVVLIQGTMQLRTSKLVVTQDEDGFQKAMEAQRVKARTAREVTNYMGADATVYDEIDVNVTTEFEGYDHLTYDSEITVLTTEKEIDTVLAVMPRVINKLTKISCNLSQAKSILYWSE